MDAEKMVQPIYDYRKKLRRRLTSLVAEVNDRPDTDRIQVLKKYEAIIFTELRACIEGDLEKQ